MIGECIDTKSVAYGPTSIDSSLGYNDVEIDDLRLPFVDDSKDDIVNDSKQAYEIDASGKKGKTNGIKTILHQKLDKLSDNNVILSYFSGSR